MYVPSTKYAPREHGDKYGVCTEYAYIPGEEQAMISGGEH